MQKFIDICIHHTPGVFKYSFALDLFTAPQFAHLFFCFFFVCLPMFSVSVEITSLQFIMGSVLFLFFICS